MNDRCPAAAASPTPEHPNTASQSTQPDRHLADGQCCPRCGEPNDAAPLHSHCHQCMRTQLGVRHWASRWAAEEIRIKQDLIAAES